MQKAVIEGYRLSPQQKHLWLLQQANHSLPYRSQCAVLIQGNLNRELLNVALQDVINRHEILRTTFYYLPEMTVPSQVIDNSNKLLRQDYDLSGWNSQEQNARIEALFYEMSQRPLDLVQGPLLHVALVILSSNKHVLLVSLPALCADRVTLKNLVGELSRSYAAYLHGEKLSDEPLQYADLAEWQNELIEAEDTAAGREYWRHQDISTLESLKLPSENQLEKAEFEPQFLTLTIHSELAGKLETLIQKYETSVFVFFLSCWQMLLGRLTVQSDITIGIGCDVRDYEGLEQALGLFAKYLPLRSHLEENCQVSELLKQVNKSIREIYQWQEYFTWEQITAPSRNDSGSSFFPFCFEFEELPAQYAASNLSFSIYQQYTCIDRFKVKLSCIQRDDSISATFYYDANIFLAKDIQRLVDQFQVLLESVINHPESAIGELDILSDRDRQQLLIQLNDTKTNYPKDQCIHQLFEEQVERTPHSVAVVFGNRQLTYEALNIRANQLAHYLQQLGVGPEVLVGICVERSLEMVVGLLGILKAGGAYVPIDPVLPVDRKTFILQDTQTPVLLTQQRLVTQLSTDGTQVVCLDANWDKIAQARADNPISGSTSENLAYVIYTSGSTGAPKGTQICHHGIVNYLTWCTQAYAVEQGEGTLVHSPLGFDLTITSLFSPLLVGRQVELLPEDLSVETLSTALRSGSNYSLVKITPAHLELLNQLLPAQEAAGRTRAFIIGGENLLAQSITFWQEYAPDTLLVNEYGPTEAVVGCCTYQVPHHQHQSGSIPIGRPIANSQLYVLNSYLQPVPTGVPGELYIGGVGLARGYLHQPDLTAEKFIPNPFSDIPGERLYKTGDLACYRPDGNLEFLGRVDHQVKIRGFRIELGEIEAVLSEHLGVQETVVIAREDEPGQKRLVAYIVPHPKTTPTISELRSFLKEQLPEYMLPSAFVLLKELPMTPNGKVDRRVLPAPDTARPELEKNFVAPHSQVEEVLAGIWRQVLGVEQVGIHDNFFELGGDSIIGIQLIAKANQAGLQLIPQQMFQYPTIAELATLAGTKQAIQVDQGPVTGPVPLTPIQCWCFENLSNPHHCNQAVLLEVRQAINPILLERLVQQLMEHHDALRLRFKPTASGWQQVNASPDETVPFSRLDLSALSEVEQKAALEATAAQLQTSLNLSEGPLLRVALFEMGEHKPDRLLIIVHHLAIDGVSWRILLEDLQTAYQQLSQSGAIHFPLKTTSFKYWAEQLQQYAQSTEIQQELDFWLAQPRQQPQLPVDYPGGANTIASTRTVSIALSVEETQALLQKVPAAYQTQINDVLLTALVQAFAQWTGVRSVLLDLEGHGREAIFQDVDLTRTVGFFTTIFPVLLDLGDNSDLKEALKAVKEQLRCVPNRGIGYGLLRYLHRDEKVTESLRSLPQAEVRFNYLGQSDQVLSESSLFGTAPESTGPDRSLQGNQSYLLDINGIVAGGQLQLNWAYSENLYQQTTIENLAQKFVDALRSLITHCQSQSAVAYAPSIELVAALNADSVLDSTIRPETPAVEPTTEPACIFLTGATGFVGAFLLHELLQQTTADIYCLVRAPNQQEGRKRIQNNLESYLLWHESLSSRIIPVVGDLSQPLLGLSEYQFLSMAEKLDVIYHNAALTNMVYPYSAVRGHNVLGTQEILRLASKVKVKPLHFISTLSVFDLVDFSEGKKVWEVDNLNGVPVPDIGYVQSKWVAEKLVTTARERGIPVSIYRLGLISGHSQTGASITTQHMNRVIKGCIQLGSLPEANTLLPMTPVDYASQAIVHLSQQKASLGKAFHVTNPHPVHWSTLVSSIRLFGYTLRLISYQKWHSELMDLQADMLKANEFNPEHSLHSLALFFPHSGSDNHTSYRAAKNFDCQNTLNELADTSIVCPLINEQLLRTYLSYLVRIGFLEAP